MHWALLGLDDETLDLAEVLALSGQGQITRICECDAHVARLSQLFPDVEVVQHWEGLLAGKAADAVIVSRSANEELRAEQLRKLVQEGMPLLVAHPVLRSMLVYYELEMIQRDTKSPLVPWLPWRLHPVTTTLRTRVHGGQESDIGRVEQVVMERQLRDRTPAAVATQFAQDVDFLRAICGELTKMGTLAAPEGPAAFANLQLQLAGPNAANVRWFVAPPESIPLARVTIFGAQGRLTLTVPDGGRPWELEHSVGGATERHALPAWSPWRAVLDDFESVVQGRPPRGATWTDAARDAELAEAIERCLRKGRTVEFHQEDFSEENTFKGTMASAGCGLLVGGVGLALVAAILHGAAGLAGWQGAAKFFRLWPYLLLGVFVLYLLLQTVLFIVSPKKNDRDDGDDAL